MIIPLSRQLECAEAVLEQMRNKNSRWFEVQEEIVKTLEKLKALEEISDEICGRKTVGVEVVA